MRSFWFAAIAAVGLGGLMACGGGSTPTAPPPPTLSSITVSPVTDSVGVGATVALAAKANYSDGTSIAETSSAAWSSSDTSKATVSTSGVVTGVATGSAVISATFQGKTGTAAVTVAGATGNATSLVLTPNGTFAYLNATVQMVDTATLTDGSTLDATNQTAWSVADQTIATISNTGLVTGLKTGTVVVTAQYGGSTQTQSITVGYALPTNDVPMIDMTAGQTYKGYEGNLYPGSLKTAPATHDAEGTKRGGEIQPLDQNGNPSSSGAIALISVGLSNTHIEFSAFVNYVNTTAGLNLNPRMAVLDGAMGGAQPCDWIDPFKTPQQNCVLVPTKVNQNQYDRVRDEVLATATGAPGAPAGCGTTSNPCLTEKQVQVIWLKDTDPNPVGSGLVPLCDPAQSPGCTNDPATAAPLNYEKEIGQILRAAKVRYPNLKQVFMASRIYAGYILIAGSPEPYAYENGYSVKWTIQAQIDQIDGKGVDAVAGDLDYNSGLAPWVAWGPYFWANGATPNSEGTFWVVGDYLTADHQHPNTQGAAKIVGLLYNFFESSAYTPWFRK